MKNPRKNDVGLIAGGILMCAWASTAGLAIGVYAQPMIIQAQAEYLAKTALMSAEELAAQQQQAILLTVVAAVAVVIVAIVAIMVSRRYHQMQPEGNALETAKPAEPEKPKGPYATGASVGVGIGCIIGGVIVSGLTTFFVGAYVEQLNNAALMEPLSIAAGVTGALALVCFAVDYYLNNKAPEQVQRA